MYWLGEIVFFATITCRRDRLTYDIPGKYLHKRKTYISQRTKSTGLFNLVVDFRSVGEVKEATTDGGGKQSECDVKKGYQRCMYHFNIFHSVTSVNSMPLIASKQRILKG